MATEGPLSEDVAALVPKRRLWPVVLVLVLLAGAGGAGAWVLGQRPEPLRVLVAIDIDGYWWEGSKPAATLADQIAVRLEKLGFEPVKGGDPEITRVLERARSPADAARELRASFVVTAELEPQVIEHPVEGGYFEVRVKGPVSLGWRQEPAREAGSVSSWAGAKDKERALSLVAEGIADMTFDAVMPAIMQHASMREILEGTATERAKLSLAKGYVELRDKRLAEALANYEQMSAKRLAEEQGKAKVTYHGAFDRAASLCASGPNGFLIKTTSARPFFAPSVNELRYVTELERVVWLTPGKNEQTLFEGYNVYGYANAGHGGKPVVLVEDLFGWAKTITLVGADGAARRLRVDPKHRFADPKIAPDGKAVALWDRDCSSCPAALLALSLPEGKDLHRTDPKAVSLGGFAWIHAKTLIFLERPKAPEPDPTAAESDAPEEKKEPEQRIVAIDLGAAEPAPELLHTAVDGESFGSPAASPDGKIVAMQRRAHDGLHLAIYDRDARKVTAYDVGGWVENPSVSPDGKWIAFERGGDIALFSLETGKTRPLTKNPFIERYPVFSSDGSRVAFESRGRDPNFSSRSVSVIASVPVR